MESKGATIRSGLRELKDRRLIRKDLIWRVLDIQNWSLLEAGLYSSNKDIKGSSIS